MPKRQTLGSRLAQARREKAARDERDIQQSDVAAAVGASKASVSRWEGDIDTPREEALARLARYLGVTPAFLRYGIQATASSVTPDREESVDTIVKRHAKKTAPEKQGRGNSRTG